MLGTMTFRCMACKAEVTVPLDELAGREETPFHMDFQPKDEMMCVGVLLVQSVEGRTHA